MSSTNTERDDARVSIGELYTEHLSTDDLGGDYSTMSGFIDELLSKDPKLKAYIERKGHKMLAAEVPGDECFQGIGMYEREQFLAWNGRMCKRLLDYQAATAKVTESIEELHTTWRMMERSDTADQVTVQRRKEKAEATPKKKRKSH